MSGTTTRPCVGCDAELDITAHYADASQGEWWRTAIGYQCGACRSSGHIPGWRAGGGRTGVATCSCGWDGDAARETLGDLALDWARHWQAAARGG